MKHTTVLLICVLSVAGIGTQTAGAQSPTTEILKDDTQTLRERYLLLKSKSQTYQDYKVIRESVLDGVWKIFQDSLEAKDAAVRQAREEIARLNTELEKNISALKAKEDSMADIVHASTHIRVLGIDFNKGFFAGLVGFIILALGLVIAIISYSMRVIRQELLEKIDLANTISAEYEDYKRRAMEKQTKLSRELQNERNKLQELGAL